MSQTSIQWTDDVWNPVTGCTKVSPGCKHCYAEGVAKRFFAKQYPPVLSEGCALKTRPRVFTDVQTHDDRLDQPLRWRKPRKVFVNSMSDLFHEDVPDAFIDRVFAVMALSPRHTFQVLTKRADRMRAYFESVVDGYPVRQRIGLNALGLVLEEHQKHGVGAVNRIDDRNATVMGDDGKEGTLIKWPLPNVWLGVSVENQHFADVRIPLLLQTPASVRFISAEPLLGPINFRWSKWDDFAPSTRRKADRCPSITRNGKTVAGAVDELDGLRMLDWVIVGGESGAGARPCDVGWIESIAWHCQQAHVPVFVKQLGAYVVDRNDAGFEGDTPRAWPMDTTTENLTAAGWQGDQVLIHLKDRKGGDIAEWPLRLRVREFPR